MRFSDREPAGNPIIITSNPAAPATPPTSYSAREAVSPDDSRATIRAALYAGVVGAVLSTLPFVANFILALPFAGFLSVLFYRRWTHGLELRPGAGFKLGALTGLFSFLGCLLYAILNTLAFHGQNAIREAMLQVLRLQQQRATDPQARQVIEYFMTPQGMIFMMAFSVVLVGVFFVLLSGAGAAFSTFLLRRKGPPQQ